MKVFNSLLMLKEPELPSFNLQDGKLWKTFITNIPRTSQEPR